MGLDAYILAKFREDAPKDVVNQFQTFHDDEIYDSGYNHWRDYKEMTYFRKFFLLQDLIERECGERITFDRYYFRIPMDKMKNIYFDLWNEVNCYPAPGFDEVENLWDYNIDSEYAESLGELVSAEQQISVIMKYSDYIEELFYYASW